MQNQFINTLLFLVAYHVCQAQCNQAEYRRIFQEAAVLQDKGAFIEAKNQYEAAKIYACEESEKTLADNKIDTLFESINQLRQEAQMARLAADSLAMRGVQLFKTLTRNENEAVFGYLLRQGRHYFSYDSTTLTRDYKQAYIYLSVAAFVQSSSEVERLILCAGLGQDAERFFLVGQVDSAETLYQTIVDQLAIGREDNSYERQQIQRIRDVKNNLENLKNRYDLSNIDTLVLEGLWWTVPAEVVASKNLKSLTITGNSALVLGLPLNILKLNGLQSLAIKNCPELIKINHWGALNNLENLTIANNIRLTGVQFSESIKALKNLSILNNPEIGSLLGLNQLTDLNSFTLTGANKLFQLKGGQTYPGLSSITITNNQFLQKINGFNRLPQLKVMTVSENPNLKSLTNFIETPVLREATFRRNDQMTEILNWKSTTGLYNLKITKNPKLTDLGDEKAMRKIRRIREYDNISINRHYATVQTGVAFARSKYAKNYSSTPMITYGIDYHKDDDKDLSAQTVYSLNTLVFKSASNFKPSEDAPAYWYGTRQINHPVTHELLSVSGKYFPGSSKIDFTYLNVDTKLRGYIRSRYMKFYVTVGGTLWFLLDGKIKLDLPGLSYEESITEHASQYYLFGGVGLSRRFRQFKINLETGYYAPTKSRTLSRKFYSINGDNFSKIETDNAYTIEYLQPLFETWLYLNLGFSYSFRHY